MSENESYLDWVTVENFRDFEDSGYTDEEILGMAQLLIEKAIPCLPKIQGKLSGPEKDLIKNAIFEMARYLKNEESNFDQATSPFQSETLGSYSYSKLLSRVKDSKDTGVPAFDRAVDMLSDLCLESVDEFGNTVSGMFTVSSERVFQPGYHNRRNTITHDRDWWSVGRDYVTKNWR